MVYYFAPCSEIPRIAKFSVNNIRNTLLTFRFKSLVFRIGLSTFKSDDRILKANLSWTRKKSNSSVAKIFYLCFYLSFLY